MSEGTAGWCKSCRVTDYLSLGGIPLAGWGIADIRESLAHLEVLSPTAIQASYSLIIHSPLFCRG